MSVPISRIGNYRVVRVLGEGGMGIVYEAVQDEIRRRVAIKVLHPEYARNPEIVRRFLNEARAVNIATHPGLVQISECGQADDGTAYLVMEFLDGETLGVRLQKNGGKLPEAQAVRFLGQIAGALVAAHACGIVHRDLKPGNVMLVRDPAIAGGERAKLVDFGIAKLGQQIGRSDAAQTRTGAMMGTPIYMAPEQCLGAALVDGKADVYSLGVMMFELLAGEPPFVAAVDLALLNMHISKVPPPLQKLAPAASGPIAKLVKRMLSKSASDRPTMAEVARLLQVQEAALPKEAVPTFEPEVDGETRLLPRNSATFHPSSERQAIAVRHRPMVALGVGLGLIALVFLTVWVPARNKQTSPSIKPSGMAAARPDSLYEVPAERPPQTKFTVDALISVLVTSQPTGAAIVRLTDNQVLGITPWRQQQPAQKGELALELRLPGYQARSMAVPLDHDSAHSEVLIAEAKQKKSRSAANVAGFSVTKRAHTMTAPAKVTELPQSPKAKIYEPANRIID